MDEIIFIDRNHVKGERTDAELRKEVKKTIEGRDIKMYGCDTVFIMATFEQEYRGIPYLIKIIGYGKMHDGKVSIYQGMNKIGKWAVVEYDKDKIGPLVDAITALDSYSEFLYHDCLHAGQENYTLKHQVELMQSWAKDDIDALMDCKIEVRMDEEVKDKEQKLAKVKEILASLTGAN